jgi:hypothetical protein
MCRWSSLVGLTLLAAPVLAAPPKAAKPPAAGPDLARLTYVERKVEQGTAAPWQEAREGTSLRIGERIRTAADAMLRADFPWMSMTMSASSTVVFPDEYFLKAVLEEGRVVLEAEGHDILKLTTAEAEVRGQGRVIVRREGKTTLVTVLAGRFVVEAAGKTLSLLAGSGTIAEGQAPLVPMELPDPPKGLAPGSDPLYVAPGEAIPLRWGSTGTAHQVEILPVGSETVLMQRDVGKPPSAIVIPWPGAFRWRVASRDERGLEGRPSRDGLICVDK